MQISIDPDSGVLVGQTTDQKYTWQEVAGLRLACPRCGTRVTVAPMDSDSHELGAELRRYYVGRHTFNCRCYSTPAE